MRGQRRQLPPAWRVQLDGREPAQWIRYRSDYHNDPLVAPLLRGASVRVLQLD